MKKKRIWICFIIIVIALFLVFSDKFLETYVKVFHESLEEYSEALLDQGDIRGDRYGLWKVHISHEDNMVEFMTGGFGLAPSSTYKGFYYSADDTHKVFSVADDTVTSLEINGNHATWTDGTDNNGISVKIRDNWFWFEASF